MIHLRRRVLRMALGVRAGILCLGATLPCLLAPASIAVAPGAAPGTGAPLAASGRRQATVARASSRDLASTAATSAVRISPPAAPSAAQAGLGSSHGRGHAGAPRPENSAAGGLETSDLRETPEIQPTPEEESVIHHKLEPLRNWARAWKPPAAAVPCARAIQEGKRLAQERREALRRMIRSNPRLALQQAL